MKPATRLEQRRYEFYQQAVAIEMHTGVWVWIDGLGKTRPVAEWNNATKKVDYPKPASKGLIDKLRRRPKTRVIFGHYLISDKKVIKQRKLVHKKDWQLPHQGIVQKQNTAKKLAKAKRLKKVADRTKREFLENIRKNDPYGINAIPNTSFGHPKRIKAFNLKNKIAERNSRNHRDRNVPPLEE